MPNLWAFRKAANSLARPVFLPLKFKQLTNLLRVVPGARVHVSQDVSVQVSPRLLWRTNRARPLIVARLEPYPLRPHLQQVIRQIYGQVAPGNMRMSSHLC